MELTQSKTAGSGAARARLSYGSSGVIAAGTGVAHINIETMIKINPISRKYLSFVMAEYPSSWKSYFQTCMVQSILRTKNPRTEDSDPGISLFIRKI